MTGKVLVTLEVCSNSGKLKQRMSGYKCYYGNARGRGEICRLSFAAANIEFEDVRLEAGEEWAKEKACK